MRIPGLRYVGQQQGAKVYVATSPRVRRWLFGDILAFVWWGSVYYRSIYVMRQKRVRRHEQRHLLQRKVTGPVLFELLYGAMHLLCGYDGNPFERDACAHED